MTFVMSKRGFNLCYRLQLSTGFLKLNKELNKKPIGINMKISISKNQWKIIGKKAGWIRKAGDEDKLIDENPQPPQPPQPYNPYSLDAIFNRPKLSDLSVKELTRQIGGAHRAMLHMTHGTHKYNHAKKNLEDLKKAREIAIDRENKSK